MNGYDLSRSWFDWCFENPEKIKPNHTALFFFCIEHCNRLGWKKKFGLPTTMAKEAIGIKSYNTYSNTLNDLVEWGFLEMIQRSKNQYSSNIIALSNFDKALDKALDKAFVRHTLKQEESTSESIDSINKQETSNHEQETSNASRFFDDQQLNAVFKKWLKMLDERGKLMTQSTIEALQMRLVRQSVELSIRQVEQSLEKGWLNLRSVEEQETKLSKEQEEEIDIAILKHQRDVLAGKYDNQPTENHRLRRLP